MVGFYCDSSFLETWGKGSENKYNQTRKTDTHQVTIFIAFISGFFRLQTSESKMRKNGWQLPYHPLQVQFKNCSFISFSLSGEHFVVVVVVIVQSFIFGLFFYFLWRWWLLLYFWHWGLLSMCSLLLLLGRNSFSILWWDSTLLL